MRVISVGIFFVIFAIFGSVIRGLVLADLWRWFVVPLGFPDISVLHAMGLAMIASFLIPTQWKIDDDEATFAVLLVSLIIPAAMVWGAGWLINSLMG